MGSDAVSDAQGAVSDKGAMVLAGFSRGAARRHMAIEEVRGRGGSLFVVDVMSVFPLGEMVSKRAHSLPLAAAAGLEANTFV